MHTVTFGHFLKKTYYYLNMKKTIPLLVLLVHLAIFSQAQEFSKVQSVFIFTFARYIQWPEGYNEGNFEIQVLGDGPIVKELRDASSAKKINNRTVVVSQISKVSEIKKSCVVFISANRSSQLDNVLTEVGAKPILVMSEEPGAGARGSNINFMVKDGKFAYEINQTTMAKKNLKVSNELSRMAATVY